MVVSVAQLQVSAVTEGIIALATTVLRLFFRRHRFWWDDACALISLLSFVLHITGLFIDTNKVKVPNSVKIASFYLAASMFYGVVWFARLSMLFSIIRIDPDPRQRKRLLFVAAIFALTVVLLVGQVFWVCESNAAWKRLSIPQCPLDTQVAVCQLVADVVSDIVLMVAPLKLFRDILNKGLRRRLILIFSASIVITVVSSVHVFYILTGQKINNLIAANVEACISLVVCNLPVFAVATIRIREVKPKNDDGLGTSRISIETSETIISMSSEY